MKSVYVAALTFGLVQALPVTDKHELVFVKRNDVSVPFYFPESTMKTFAPSASFVDTPQTIEEAVAFAKAELVKETGVDVSDLEIKQAYQDIAGVTHVYVVRKINGVAVDNHVASVHIQHGQVLSLSSSFKQSANQRVVPPSTESKFTLEEAVAIASKQLGVPRDDFPASQIFLQLPSGKVVYGHQFQLRDDKQEKWYQVVVDATNGQVVQVVDYVQQASYKALKLPKTDPTDGGFEVVSDPQNLATNASPKGWHDDGSKTYTTTKGNNVDSHVGTLFVDGQAALNFDHQWDGSKDPTTDENKKAAIVNNFYLSNSLHDISYQYGFTEKAGNFQNDNFGKGGKGGDAVYINNQASGTNNANFATPPDGQRPTMNMYTWTTTSPNRDGSLDNVIPMHEYTHGISNRMTGGSGQANCLGTTEARGMGEGWSDTVGIYLIRKEGENRNIVSGMGPYATNKPTGVRQYFYSTDMMVNPLMYNNLKGNFAVHSIGTVWGTMLWEMYWNFVDKYGFSSNYYDAKQSAGNIKALQVVFGGLALQPCNPTFITARDAILTADQSYYGGENKCLIWKAFAKRGLGTDAVQSSNYVNAFKIPTECQTE